MKSANKFTVAALLASAAAYLTNTTNPRTGSHPTVSVAITEAAAAGGYRKGVGVRAHKLFAHHYHADVSIPKTRVKGQPAPAQTFGKNQSTSQQEHPVKSVLRNRDQRVAALLLVSKIAEGHHTTWYK